MVFRMSTTPSCRSCWQQMLVAMKQPVLPIPALRAEGMGGVRGGAAGVGGCPALAGGWEDPPAVDDDGGAVRPLLLGSLLHLLHQVQERGGPVWGLLVGPGRKPVMLQASLFSPALSRRQRPTPDTRELCEPTQHRDGDGMGEEEHGGRTQGVGPLASAMDTTLPSGTRQRPKPAWSWRLAREIGIGLHTSSRRGKESPLQFSPASQLLILTNSPVPP